ncbi:unannotated protein [freshwater metagenome]|uniref:Unannotated protein n=1 Tax=freshwater metagenome TaxID=449393 RepID=A0A6J6DZH9_9ZZZZ|nr:hypothetical protein [Actinomycetota bacterium]
MSRLLRPTRLVAAAALVVSSFAIFGASPAGAATGSLTAISNGVTVTYTGSTTNDNVQLLVWPSGHTCTLNDSSMQATYYLTSDASSPSGMQLAASPASLTFGSAAFTLQGFATTTIAAGSYTFCLKTVVAGPGGQAIAAQLDAVIVDPNATTTTTSTSTTTTVAPGSPTTSDASGSTSGDPVAPAFTG